jgi:DNA-binding NtrC family response regulator
VTVNVRIAVGTIGDPDAGTEDGPMTRVLVVHHDIDVADIEVEALRHAGYEVDQCGGPTHALTACPVMRGQPCWQVDAADVVLYDAWAAGDGAADLTADLRVLYPRLPVVLTTSGMELDWEEKDPARRTTTVVGAPTRANLAAAIEEALAKARAPVAD